MTNYLKLLIIFSTIGLALAFLLRPGSPKDREVRLEHASVEVSAPGQRSATNLLSVAGAKPVNRAPAFVHGSEMDASVASKIDAVLKRHHGEALSNLFPASRLPLDRAIRASLLLALEPEKPDGITPEDFQFSEEVAAYLQAHPNETIASVDSLLESIPADGSDDALDSHRFLVRTLSNLGISSADSRSRAKAVLLKEAQRASSQSEGALAFAAMLRMSPSKEWQREVSRAFETMHPGSELSEFVAIRLGSL